MNEPADYRVQHAFSIDRLVVLQIAHMTLSTHVLRTMLSGGTSPICVLRTKLSGGASPILVRRRPVSLGKFSHYGTERVPQVVRQRKFKGGEGTGGAVLRWGQEREEQASRTQDTNVCGYAELRAPAA
jgi:hypothetical protein